MIGKARDDVDAGSFEIDTGEPAVFHERDEIGQARPGVVMGNLQSVLGANLEWRDRLLDQTIFDHRRGFAEAAEQRRSLTASVHPPSARPWSTTI